LHDKIATNPTLQFAQKHGMQFEFVSREEYRLKAKVHFRKFKKKYGDFTSFLREVLMNIKGCQEILTKAV
jgi:1-aminocyclopropane-1-carboxylate deaminase